MTTEITAKIDTGNLVNTLGALFNDKYPKAVTVALNKAAFLLRQRWIDTIVQTISRPVAFTKAAPVYERATPDSLQSRTYLRPAQADYLGHMIEGIPRLTGDKSTTKSGSLIPVSALLTAEGNFPKGPLRWLAGLDAEAPRTSHGGGIFIGSIRGKGKAVWERGTATEGRGHLHLLAVFAGSVAYKQRLPLIGVSETFAAEQYDSILSDAMRTIL